MASQDTPPSKVILLPNGMLDARPRGEYVKIFEKNRLESPLLKLPAELRNRVYEFATWRTKFRDWNLAQNLLRLLLQYQTAD
ncbi:hypothetical protein BDV96DRAFT_643493 [Lophiotrema nucula]|uniref:Uncharacterized protein n=1 Tax=Lophiotrema nucula TaxID=690887 RepID=A0A6A5ZIJ4_9PLEO|nr:hypothetical protein BDV96DRAFT_643493 [Lophiotrema nucula]